MEDVRVPFDEAKRQFQKFLRLQGWPPEILWLSRERIAGRRRTYWVFRPEELAADDASRAFYEAARQTPSSIRLDAVGRLADRSLAYVEDFGGPSRMLNFGVLLEPWIVRSVSSPVVWTCIRAASRICGGTPLLRSMRITG